jgi:methionyl-tRNA formyltransferase
MRIVFFGTPDFAVPSLNMLAKEGYDIVAVVTQPDKPKGRGKKIAASPVKEYAIEKNIPVLQPDKIKTGEFLNQLADLKPDLLITSAYGKILSKEVLEMTRFGCINVHGSLLPKYRGAAPIHWAIINGENASGITTMYTDVGLDTGDMIIKGGIKISEDMTAGELHDKMAVLGAEVLKMTLFKLQQGELMRVPQVEEEATYAPMIKKEIGLIDWFKSAKEIHNLVRGTNPWPGAYSFYKGNKIRVWKTEVMDDCSSNLRAGLVCKADKEGIIIMTGKGTIKILEIQLDSSKRMKVENYLCGHTINEGEYLG